MQNKSEILEQIRAKQTKQPQDLNINKNFYNNIRQMQSKLESEVAEKGKSVGMKGMGKRQIFNNVNSNPKLQIIGGDDRLERQASPSLASQVADYRQKNTILDSLDGRQLEF